MIRALVLGCAALSVAGQAPAPIDCVIRRIVMDLPASDDPTGARGIARCNPVTLCCPSTTRAHLDTGCVLLYGINATTLGLAQPGEIVRIRPEPSAIGPSLSAVTLASFGNLAPVTGSLQLDPPYSPDSEVIGGLEPPPPPAGALFVDRTANHGNRTTLHVIVGAQDPGNGDVRNWSQPCREFNVRRTFFGSDGGSNYATGPSPYALRPECRLANSTSCRFNTRDHLRSVSQNRVDFVAAGSKVVTQSSLQNYPPAFCAFNHINNQVRNAVRATGVEPDAFGNMIVYVPKHCAIGQGEQPVKNVIVQMCPGGDRDNLYSAISHELGHNLGLGHGSLYGGSEYGDASSFMGSGGGGRVNTLSLAQRHAFRWLPGDGRSGVYVNGVNGASVAALVLRLVDVNTAVALPVGGRWGAKVDDVDASWYVSYRGCTAYDATSKAEWCGGVQVSRRVGSSTQAFHVAWLRVAGASAAFGANGLLTVTLGSRVEPMHPQVAAVVVLSIARK
jgi:hypothetical protein